MSETHDALVAAQFSSQASAYVASVVHAAGPDLDALATIVERLRPARALDLGAGGGHVSYVLAPFAQQVVACDPLVDMLRAIEKFSAARGLRNIETAQGSALAPPFVDAAFDFLASRYSVHHWLDFHRGLREARRVLRKGANAVFIDVVSTGGALQDTFLQAIELLRDRSHVRNYTAAEWLSALTLARFDLKSSQNWRIRLDFDAWTQRMKTPEENIQVIRALQNGAPSEIRTHFNIEPDGSFEIDVRLFEATAA
jgi:SAM-dependent methyltransferase